MSDDRYFDNKLPNFQDGQQLLDKNLGKILPQHKEKIHDSALRLIKELEKNIKNEIDWKDISVYTGSSGYIYLYLHLFEKLKNSQYFQDATSIAEKSTKLLKCHRETFLCGDAGPLALASIVYDKHTMYKEVEWCISKLLKLQSKVLDINSDLPDELLYGRVGYLYSLLLVQQKVESHSINQDLIRSIITCILESGKLLSKRRKARVPLSYEWHGKNYLGAAHGVCGILTILLQVKDNLTPSELNELVRPTIDDLKSHIFPSGNLASSVGSSSDRLVHWCHGAPAAVFLFALAFQVFGDQNYLHVARNAAEVIWNRGLLKKGYGLCHGTAGNGYALLYMYQITKEKKYLHMAIQFANWCCDYGRHGCRTPDRPFSLFEGMAGTIYFLIDIQEPDNAKFPAFIL